PVSRRPRLALELSFLRSCVHSVGVAQMIQAGFSVMSQGTKIRELDRRTAGLKRGRSSLENLNKLQSFTAAADRLRSLLDALDEVLAGHFQRLFLLDMRDVAIAVMIGVLELDKGV